MAATTIQTNQRSATVNHHYAEATANRRFSVPLWRLLIAGLVASVALVFGLRAFGRGVLGVPSGLPSLAASALLAAAIFPVLGNCFGFFMSFRVKPSAHSMRLFIGIGAAMTLVGIAISATKLPKSPSFPSVALTVATCLLPSILIIAALLLLVPRPRDWS
jgi:hypothetical protein